MTKGSAAPQAAQRLTRLLRLFIALCTAPAIGLPGRGLISRLGVSKATLYRDLGLLRACGLCVEAQAAAGQKRYRLTDRAVRSWTLPLAVGHDTDALERFDSWLNTAAPEMAAGLPRAEVRLQRARARLPADVLAIVEGARVERQRLRLFYAGRDAVQPAWRLVDPAILREHDGQLYLVAYDLDRKATRQFKLSRVVRAELTGVAAAMAGRVEFDGQSSVGVWAGPSVHVELWVAPDYVQLVEEHPLPAQTLVRLADGSARLHCVVAGEVEVTAAVLRWGPGVRVLAPESLRERVVGQLEAALARYRGAGVPGDGVSGS